MAVRPDQAQYLRKLLERVDDQELEDILEVGASLEHIAAAVQAASASEPERERFGRLVRELVRGRSN